jgi:phosphoribosyl 1,2-cyclic phosphate phosphodiesterase
MQLIFLGTGTSTGVPAIGCRCATCTSTDERDRRLRASALLRVDGCNLLIDCGPDFRQQILRLGSPELSALLVTHYHYDHVGGVDDLRPYCVGREGGFPIYCRRDVAEALRRTVPYGFGDVRYPGAPSFAVKEIDVEPVDAEGVAVTPLPVMHNRLPILGFRVGPLAYITDAKTVADSTVELLRGVDTLVVNALRWQEHFSHFSVDEALELVAKVGPRRTYFTHMSHAIGLHEEVSRRLPHGVELAYDCLTIEI